MLQICKHFPLFFQVPNYPFFMMTADKGYGQNILKTLWGCFSPPTPIPPFPPSGAVLLFHLSSRGVKPKALEQAAV